MRVLVPLHYLTDGITAPVWCQSGSAPSSSRVALPTAKRAMRSGGPRSAVDSLPQKLRVAVVGTGSFSLEIGGPKIDPGKRNSVPDIEWSKHIHRRIAEVRIDELIDEATPERMWQAGNIGGELLNWIVTLGVIGKDKPRYLADHDDKDGHAYAVWRWD